MGSYLKDRAAAPVYKTEINVRGGPPRQQRDTPLSAKFGTKIRRPATVVQSV
jgi:hypothetical protein